MPLVTTRSVISKRTPWKKRLPIDWFRPSGGAKVADS